MVDTIIPPARTTRRVSTSPVTDRAAALAVRAVARNLRGGTLVLREAGVDHRFGAGDPVATVTIHDRRAYRALVGSGSVGLAQSYVDGWWDCDSPTALVQLLIRNLGHAMRVADRAGRLTGRVSAPLRRVRPADRVADRRNVRAHYDLGNEFFELMLDETMAYSCAVFDGPDVSLREASTAKLDRVCRKLGLGPNDHVVEIGTGWGSFAVYAASTFGCEVTTTTVSDAQYTYATKRVAEAGLARQVTVLDQDYRDLEGTYDKLVSIEMIEAVGWQQLDTFLSTCSHLLRDDGLMALQMIVVGDSSYERAKRHQDFIKRLIFPGGCLHSVEAVARSAARATDLRIVDLEDIGCHYAETLRRWRANLRAHGPEVAALDLGERFQRLWDFYLCYCEAAFAERHVTDVQIVLAKRAWRGALVTRPA